MPSNPTHKLTIGNKRSVDNQAFQSSLFQWRFAANVKLLKGDIKYKKNTKRFKFNTDLFNLSNFSKFFFCIFLPCPPNMLSDVRNLENRKIIYLKFEINKTFKKSTFYQKLLILKINFNAPNPLESLAGFILVLSTFTKNLFPISNELTYFSFSLIIEAEICNI